VGGGRKEERRVMPEAIKISAAKSQKKGKGKLYRRKSQREESIHASVSLIRREKACVREKEPAP